MQDLMLWSVALGIAAVGGYTDVRGGKVYNLLTYPAMLAGLILQTTLHGSQGLLSSLGGIAVGFVLLLGPYLMAVVGGGDVKLLAAVGAFLGPFQTVQVLLFGAVAGGVLAVVILMRRKALWPTIVTLLVTPRAALQTASSSPSDFPFATIVPLGLLALRLLSVLR